MPWAESERTGPWAGSMAASHGGGTGSCPGRSIVVAGAGGAMDGDALETGGTTYSHVGVLGVAEISGSRAADVVGLGVVDSSCCFLFHFA